jgi:hypothetical protein
MSDELARLIKQLIVKVDMLNREVKKLSNPHISEQYYLIDKHEAALRTGLSAATLKQYRLDSKSPLIAGIHYVQENPRSVKYQSPLIEHWASHRHDPDAHLAEIEKYLEYQKSKSSPAA